MNSSVPDPSDFDPMPPFPAENEAPSTSRLAGESRICPALGSRRLFLMVPVDVEGECLRSIDLRLPTQGDIDDWGNGELTGTRALLCRLTNLEPSVVRKLAWPDSEALHQMLRDILPEFIFDGVV